MEWISGNYGVWLHSLGATPAANLYFQTDPVDRLLALSGLYSAGYGFGSYTDEVVHRNSLVDFLGDMSKDDSRITLYNLKKAVICVGQGPWELPDSTRQLSHLSWRRRTSMRGWISGVMTVPMTGTGGISRWNILSHTCSRTIEIRREERVIL